jgi:alkylated DNA repair dioxygenase AlkB
MREDSTLPHPLSSFIPSEERQTPTQHHRPASVADENHKQAQTSFTMKNPFKSHKKFKNLSNLPSLGPDDTIGEGDSSIKYGLLSKALRDEINPNLPLSDTIFRAISHEVQWQKMYHAAGEVPRLVAVQGTIGEDGSKPVYRHPSDQAPPLLPFTKYVDLVRREAEKVVGHPLNHVLIQLYRSGQDYISEHSDKTLDIHKGSSIVNASFGAQRTMRLRTKRTAKKDAVDTETAAAETSSVASNTRGDAAASAGVERVTQRIHMPHNSLFILGLKTNRFWVHGINQDKRAERDRTSEELANNGMRISLTFRQIGTFLSADEDHIWGQGAKSKSKEFSGKCINADDAEAGKMIDAFGFENKEGAAFDWDNVYGEGFDVLNLRAMEMPKLDVGGEGVGTTVE